MKYNYENIASIGKVQEVYEHKASTGSIGTYRKYREIEKE